MLAGTTSNVFNEEVLFKCAVSRTATATHKGSATLAESKATTCSTLLFQIPRFNHFAHTSTVYIRMVPPPQSSVCTNK